MVGLPNAEICQFLQSYRGKPSEDESNYKEKIVQELQSFVSSVVRASICEPIADSSILYFRQSNNNYSAIGFQDLPHTLKTFFNKNVQLDAEHAEQLCFDTIFQNNNIWKKARKIRLTCSSVYLLYTFLKSHSDEEVWEDKILKFSDLDDKFKGNADTRHGLAMEPKSRKNYEDNLGVKISQLGFLVNSNIPFLGYSADGVVLGKNLIEIKSPQAGKEFSFEEAITKLKFINIDPGCCITLKTKHEFFMQIQLGMFLTGMKLCHFVIYFSKDDFNFIIPVDYDEELVT